MTIRSSDLRKRLLRVAPTMLVGAVLKDIGARPAATDWLLLCPVAGGQAILSVADLSQGVAMLDSPLNQTLESLDLRASPAVDMEAELIATLSLFGATGYVLVLRDGEPYGVLTARSIQSHLPAPTRALDPSAQLESLPVAKGPLVLSDSGTSLLEQAASWQPRRQGPAVLGFGDEQPPVVSATIEPVSPRSDRYVNTDFAAADTPDQALNNKVALLPGQTYFFRLNVGELELETTIEESRALLPDFITKQDAELVVVLFSESFTIEQANGVLTVPTIGLATVKQPASLPSGMRADAPLAQARLLFRVQTPAIAGRADLRVNMYCKGMLIQSRLVTAVIGQGAALNQAGATRISTLDFNLSPALAPSFLSDITPHTLSLMVNSDSAGTTHAFRLFGQDGNEVFQSSATMSEAELTDLIKQARNVLQQVAWGYMGDWDQKTPYRYDPLSAAQSNWRDDVIRLAVQGYRLYDNRIRNLAGSNAGVDKLRDLMRLPGVVQLANKVSANDVVPIALFYDYDLDTQSQQALTICPQFEDSLKSGRDLLGEPCFQGNCPSRDGHFTVVCPSGFWGFRHDIGMPWPVPGGPEMAKSISYTGEPLMDIAFYQFPELGAHLDRLGQLGFQTQREDARASAITMFQSTNPQVVYFYCHGVAIKQTDQTSLPALMIGSAAAPGFFDTTNFRPFRIRWPDARPLVLINGCHTTQISPEQALSFVRTFVEYVEAAGVIGTEITVFEPLAQRFAESFLARFQQGELFGRAIRQARLQLLAQSNPLGLVYQPFAYAGLKLSRQ